MLCPQNPRAVYAGEFNVFYDLYAQILKKYVNDQGQVDYAGLKTNPDDLNEFVQQMESTNLSGFSLDELKAFWINAYNVITLKVVTDKYPVQGIRRINFGLVWQVPRKAAGKNYSLGHIEHKIIRPMNDPRIHFALNCASLGCPRLSREPFLPERIDQQLDREARRFINDPEKVRLDRAANILRHSVLFDWFKEDFLKESGSILDYIKMYINESDKFYLDSNPVTLRANEYDWGLNKQ